jgi:hypothetical protein
VKFASLDWKSAIVAEVKRLHSKEKAHAACNASPFGNAANLN